MVHRKVVAWKTVVSILPFFNIGISNKRWREDQHLFGAFYIPGALKICINSFRLYNPPPEGGLTISTLWISTLKLREVNTLASGHITRQGKGGEREISRDLTPKLVFFYSEKLTWKIELSHSIK